MTAGRLELSRAQVLAHRRTTGALDERLPVGPESLRRAAWAGLPDSMPRAALLSIHARVAGTRPTTWEDPSLVQLWGPRFSAYVVAATDLPVFSLGRYPDDARGRRVAEEMAARLDEYLGGRRMRYDDAGVAIGVHPNALRYGAQTGRVLIRWEGARRPLVWTVPRPDVDPIDARLELCRRYLHVLGPSTASSFRRWAGIGVGAAKDAFARLAAELLPAATAIGDGWILATDEASFRVTPVALRAAPARPGSTADVSARLLPSGDTYVLLHGRDRELLVPEAERQALLWTPRVWPGAVLVDGEIVGTWRRDGVELAIQPWRRLSPAEREAVVAEGERLPLPGLVGPMRLRWLA